MTRYCEDDYSKFKLPPIGKGYTFRIMKEPIAKKSQTGKSLTFYFESIIAIAPDDSEYPMRAWVASWEVGSIWRALGFEKVLDVVTNKMFWDIDFGKLVGMEFEGEICHEENINKPGKFHPKIINVVIPVEQPEDIPEPTGEKDDEEIPF
jgi:hypothetical protein